jgi:hypothetical protein
MVSISTLFDVTPAKVAKAQMVNSAGACSAEQHWVCGGPHTTIAVNRLDSLTALFNA